MTIKTEPIMKNSLLKTSLVAFFISSLTITNAQNTDQKTELKPVTTTLKKESSGLTVVEIPKESQTKIVNSDMKQEIIIEREYKYAIKDSNVVEQRKTEAKENSLKKERIKNPILKEFE